MALKDLLVYLEPSNRSLVHLELAFDLARRNASAVTALYVRAWTAEQIAHRRTAELAGRPLAEMQAMGHDAAASLDESAHEARSTFERLAARHRLQSQWLMIDGEPHSVLAQHARYADLCILGAYPDTDISPHANRLSEEMLFSTGHPVLMVPQHAPSATLGSHVAVAWNSSRSAARALNDALPLFETCQQATVIAVNSHEVLSAHGAPPLSDLLEHLRRHGVTAQLVEQSNVPPAEVAGVLQEQARAVGADLLVAGAYGHTWLREVLLGSVTRNLLANLTLPVMMSH